MRFSLLLLVGFLATSMAFGQTSISGSVMDQESNEPLIGANVVVQGTTIGTITDIDGKFNLNVPADAENLVISYSGYDSQIIPIAGGNFSIVLSAGALLDEVVVVGYGTQRSKEITSSVSSVSSEDFIVGNVNSPAQLLQGKVPGLTIVRNGGDPNGSVGIRLRGLSTIGAQTEPLVIIDGVPGGSLSNIDPNDIETVDVLKDGSAAAIYGSRGSSGVILITTKKGAKGTANVTYNGYVGTESILNTPSILSADDYIAAGGDPLNGDKVDYYDEISRRGFNTAHNVSLSGGTEKTTYRASFNYRNQAGVVLNTGFDQLNGGLSITQKALNDKLKVSLNYLATTRNNDFGFAEAFRYATITSPTSSIKNADGSWNNPTGFDVFNPVAMVTQNISESEVNESLMNAFAEYSILPGLKLTGSYARQKKIEFGGEFYPNDSRYRGGIDRNGVARRYTLDDYNNLYESTLSYTGDVGKVNYSILTGASSQDFTFAGQGIEAGGFLLNATTYNDIGQSQEVKNGTANVFTYKNGYKIIGQFARANVNFNDTYFASASVRREGSDRLGEDNRWGIFPAISVGADLAKILNIGSVDQLKLRAGYGITGNLPGQSYLFADRYSSGASFFFNGGFVPSFGPVTNANPDLKWETKGEINVGIDYALLNNKLYGSLDVFNRTTSDLILFTQVSVPPNLASNTWKNSASFTTSGVELGLSYDVAKSESFSYTPTLIFTSYRTILNSYLEDVPSAYITNLGAPGQNITDAGVGLHFLEEGQPIGQITAPEFEGVNADGTFQFVDQNEDGEINADDWIVVGNGLPDFELSLNNSMKFGAVDVNLFFRGAFGHSIVNTNRAFYEFKPDQLGANVIETSKAVEGVKTASYNSIHVEKGDFVKLDNASIGYTFGTGNSTIFRNARVYVAGQNVLTFTGYTGVDPEVILADFGAVDNGGRENTFGDPLAPGVDRRNTYFSTRTFTFGLSLGF